MHGYNIYYDGSLVGSMWSYSKFDAIIDFRKDETLCPIECTDLNLFTAELKEII